VREGVKADVFSLGSGVVIAALGALILLDASDVLDMSLGWIAVALAAAVGAILVFSGLAAGGPNRHD
jgi:hypothetical protein